MSVTSPLQDDHSIPNQMTRLHITPFNPTLLNVIVPPSILPSAKNISYHSLQTFPEKSYGFVELPNMDAEKIKKKLNGSILKGSKIRIEEARPPTEPIRSMDVEITPKKSNRKVEKGSRKRKRHDEILPGVELRDRKVQRGWTTPTTESKKSEKRQKDKKDKKAALAKSKFTTQPECLFKTSLPLNVAANLKDDSGPSSLEGKLRRKKSSRTGKKEVLVHEFSKTTKHATFLRGSGVPAGSSSVSSYVEGKGWVDKDGNVIEAEIPKRKRPTLARRSIDAESSSAVSSTSEEEDSSGDEVEDSILKAPPLVARDVSVTSSSGTSSEGDEEEDDASSSSSSDLESEDSASETSQHSEQESRPGTASSIPPSLSLAIPNIETTPVQVHPLEALYKKSKTDGEATTATPSFSFFNDDGNEDIDNSQPDTQNLAIPMTPFTKEEFEYRGIRSAAPTPDTAHPGKTYAVWPNPSTSSSSIKKAASNDPDQEDEEDEDDDAEEYAKSPIPDRSSSSKNTKAAEETAPTSDFQKWFYEHRGDANRAWKKRRKVVSKEKRHRENKKRGDRAV